MLRKSLMVLGTGSILLMTAGCLGYGEDRYPPPPPYPPEAAEQPDVNRQSYNVAPRPNPRKEATSQTESNAHGQPAKTAEAGAATTHPKSAENIASNEIKKSGSVETKKNEKTADATKPLTPAEIRAAVPVQKVTNPKQTLSSAKIRSLWGDVLGHVHSVDVSDGTVKAVDADVGKGVVRIDAKRLKYVKSRNVLVTTMSKPDVAKLPRVDNP
jgi:hypothetical protein